MFLYVLGEAYFKFFHLISALKNYSRLTLLIWNLGVFIIIALSGVAPQPPEIPRALKTASHGIQQGQPENAVKALVYITERLPWRTTLWDLTGQTAYAAGDPALAVQYLVAAGEENQLSVRGSVILGKAYNQLGDTASAEVVWSSLRDVRGLDTNILVDVNNQLLNLYQGNGDLPAAIATLQRITELEPSNAEVQYQLGLLMVAREPEIALGYLINAMELNPGLADAVKILQRNLEQNETVNDPAFNDLNVGRALGYLGEWELAAAAFYQAVEQNPDYGAAWAFLGEAQQQLGEDGASEIYRALQIAPDSFEVNTLAALFFQRQGDYEKALEHLNISLDLQPGNPAITAEIGNTFGMPGDIETALNFYRQAAASVPKNPTYWYLLSQYSLNNDLQVRTTGIPAARQALLINPDDPIAADLVGYGYYLLGDGLTAERFLTRALQADPEYAPAYFHLGMLRFSQGDLSAANIQLRRTISLVPDTPLAAEAERILERFYP